MAFAPLVLSGGLTINDVDVSQQVKAFRFAGTRVNVPIPATFDTDMSFAAGPGSWQVEVEYLSDVDSSSLTQVFWSAMTTAPHTVTVSGTVRAGAVSASNPRWYGTAVVTSWGLGGGHYELGTDSVVFNLTAAPTQSIS
jgi:PKD repeat protein